MSYFIAAQLVGILTAVVSIIIVQFKKIRWILVGEVFSNLLIAVSYALVGGWSGASLCFAASIHTITAYFFSKSDKRYPIILTVLFEAVYIACSVFSYKGIDDALSCVAALLFGLAIVQKNASKYRILMLINSILWIIYDISTGALTNIFTHGFLTVSILFAMLRLDLKKKK